MDKLTKMNSLSIAELRKILKDNDVKETSSDKEGLIYQATDVLLTNMAIQDMMEYDTIIPFKKVINENVKLLKELVSSGFKAGVLFVCQRQDPISFQPMWEIDPKFSAALLDAYQKGVRINCITLNVSKSQITFNKEIAVKLENDNKSW